MDPIAAVDSLSPQQRRCLDLVGQGKTTPQIAYALRISEGTANGYIAKGTAKLGVATRREAGYLVLSAARAEPLQKMTAQNLRLDPSSISDAPTSQSPASPSRPTLEHGTEKANGRGVLGLIVVTAGLVVAIVIILVALKPLTESYRGIANLIQPDRPH